MHSVILGIKGGEIEADHRDGDGLNNQKDNLRKSSHAQNCLNRRKNFKASSQYKGVHLFKSKYTTKWRAKIFYNGEEFSLGLFGNEQDAAMAYNEAAIKYHGEFASLNIIQIENKAA